MRLRWQDPDSLEKFELAQSFNTEELAPSFETTSAQFRLAVMVAAFAEELRESYWAQGFAMEDLVAQLESSAWPEFEALDIIELEGLIRRSASLD